MTPIFDVPGSVVPGFDTEPVFGACVMSITYEIRHWLEGRVSVEDIRVNTWKLIR